MRLEYQDRITTLILSNPSSVYRFPNYSVPKTNWQTSLQVKCGWAKTWDPPSVLGCVDPRGCQPPPARTSEVWGSYDDDEAKSLEVGVKYWYSCRAGMFQVINNITKEGLYYSL